MIRKILKLQNVGLLQDATQNGPVHLAQVTAIYADNGRGKSTLAAVLRSCQLGDSGRLNARRTIDVASEPEVKLLLSTGSHVEFTTNAWSTTLPEIVVFDSEFVEQNVHSGFEVRADHRQSLLEFALGDQTVRLKQQIDQLTQEIETQTRKRTQAEKTLTGFAPPYTVTQFIALQSVPDAQQQIDALEKRIEAAKNSQQLVARKGPLEIASVHFDLATVFAVLKTEIQEVEQTAEEVVKIHLASHNSADFEDWVSRGQNYLSQAQCPFCGLPIDGLALIAAYRSYFNKAYTELKRQVARLEAQVGNGLADSKIEAAISAAATNTARIEAWKDQLDLTAPSLDSRALSTAMKQVREQLLSLVALKQRAPLDLVGSQTDFDIAAAAIDLINRGIDTYNSEIRGLALTIAYFNRTMAT